MPQRIIGILGGMGPEATCALFQRIIDCTGAKCDREHIRIIIDNNPQIPDRTAAILNKGTSPVPELVKTALNLEKAGVDFIVIPCITSHYFIDDIQKEIKIPIINALEITRDYIDNELPHLKKIGVIATTGTIKSGLFQKYLAGKDIIIPTASEQEQQVMEIIYGPEGIKAGNKTPKITDGLADIAEKLKKQEAQAIIAGCTEISLVLKQADLDIPLIDPLTLLARKSVSLAKNVS